MKIEVSNGELLDKYSILLIKKSYITDSTKLINIQNELDELDKYVATIFNSDEVLNLYGKLYNVNLELWSIEDRIRECEKRGEFNEEFISLARSVYKTNDRRAEIKKEINLLTNSKLVEEKSYEHY